MHTIRLSPVFDSILACWQYDLLRSRIEFTQIGNVAQNKSFSKRCFVYVDQMKTLYYCHRWECNATLRHVVFFSLILSWCVIVDFHIIQCGIPSIDICDGCVPDSLFIRTFSVYCRMQKEFKPQRYCFLFFVLDDGVGIKFIYFVYLFNCIYLLFFSS